MKDFKKYLKKIVIFFLLSNYIYSNNHFLPFNDSVKKKDILLKNWPLRGITVVTHRNFDEISGEMIDSLSNLKINFVRLRLSIRRLNSTKNFTLDEKINSVFSKAKKFIEMCSQKNIFVIISHSDFPNDQFYDFDQTSIKFWGNEFLLKKSIDFINRVVIEFDHFENLIGYEFFAEPVVRGKFLKSRVPQNWNNHFLNILKTIRNKSTKYVVYTPGPWGDPKGYQYMKNPINDRRILYNFHFYQPNLYTHQLIKKNKNSYSYPGYVKYRYIDKNFLKKRIEIASNWANKYNVPLFIGEFSVNQKAPDKLKYLKDVINIFEEKKLSYCYANFNGYEGWSYPFSAKSNEKKILDLLKSYWDKNNLDYN